MTEPQELNDTKIALLLKNALEYNAETVKTASFIYGQDIAPKQRRRLYKEFVKLQEKYDRRIKDALGIENE